ncbi:MAG: EamA family transporter [Syntrophorhabdaceae bacterium]|nr:EamA family transporter [Syntrophorhabdaceae bacterium]
MEREHLSDFLLLCVSAIWGANLVAVKFLLGDLSPVNVILIRFITGSVLLFLLLFFLEDVKVPPRDIWRLTLLGAVGIALYQFLFTFALKYTSAVNVGILINMSPIYGGFLSSLFGYEKFVKKRLLAIVTGFIGVYILMTKGDWASFMGGDVAGNVLALLASLSWALYTILSKPLLEKHSPLKVTAYSMAAGSILLGFFVPSFFDWGELARLSLTGWLIVIFSIIFSIVVAFFLWYRGVARIGASRTMIYQYCVPAFGAIAAYFVLSETLHFSQLIGGSIIFLSVYLARR